MVTKIGNSEMFNSVKKCMFFLQRPLQNKIDFFTDSTVSEFPDFPSISGIFRPIC